MLVRQSAVFPGSLSSVMGWIAGMLLLTVPLVAEDGGLRPVAVVKGGYFEPSANVQHILRGIDLKEKATKGIDRKVVDAHPLIGDPIELGYAGLDATATYRMTAHLIADTPRTVRIRAGNEVVEAAVAVAAGAPVERTFIIPPAAYAGGTLLVTFEKVSGGEVLLVDATLSSSNPTTLKPYPTPVVEIPRLSPRPAQVPGCAAVSLDLTGTWLFHPAPPAGFHERPIDQTWAKIAVPGEWWLQGFEVKPGTAAAYRRTFTVPAEWKGRRIKLRCDAVYSEATVWVNGRPAGSHVGGFTQFELDISDLVTTGGENTLSIAVVNEGPADNLTCGSTYACHPIGGILRPISLIVLPEVNVASLHVTTAVAGADAAEARLNLEIGVAREGRAAPGVVVARLALTAPDGKPVTLVPDHVAVSGTQASLSIPVAAPLTWDPERPRLYTLEVRLESGGVCGEVVAQKVGFRQIEVRGNQLLVNGRAVKLRGVNHHETHPTAGRAVPAGLDRTDVGIFREANVNLLRTSHYPPNEELLEAADELGMFIECEAPFCWTVGCGSTELVVRQTGEMAMAYRNHPSILFWSLGNESKWGTHFMASSALLHQLDPTRPQDFNDNGSESDPSCTQLINSHYGGYKDVELSRKGLPQPFYHGEDSHMNCYNRLELATDPGIRDLWGIHLLKLWEQMDATQGTVGQSIWAGVDDVFFTKDGQTIECRVWGIIDGWRRKRPEWWGVKKAYSPIRISDREKIAIHDGQVAITVENRQNFANLSEMAITWRLAGQSGVVSASAPPRGKGTLRIPMPVAPKPGELLEVTFSDPRGFPADQYAFPLVPATVPERAHCATTVSEAGPRITVTSGTARWEIDRASGQVVSGNGRPLHGPQLTIVPLSHVGGTQANGKPKVWEPLTAPCAGWACTAVSVRQQGSAVEITVDGSYAAAKGSYVLRFADGLASITYRFAITKVPSEWATNYVAQDRVNPRQIGLSFALPSTCNTLTWERKGLWDTYPEDHIGRLSGRVRSDEGHEATAVGPMTRPDHPWRLDNLPYGNNDFCSTKHQFLSASLTDPQGTGLQANGHGTQHVRCWNTGTQSFLLVADYSNGGLGAYLHRLITYDRRPLKIGDEITGTVELGLVGDR